MPDTQTNEIVDEYQCDTCKNGSNAGKYYSPDTCIKCDGTSKYEPIKENKDVQLQVQG